MKHYATPRAARPASAGRRPTNAPYRIARLALWSVLVGMILSGAMSLARLLSASPRSAPVRSERENFLAPATLTQPAVPGSWKAAEIPWSLAWSEASDQQVSQVLESPPQGAAEVLSPEGQEAFQILHRLCRERREIGEWIIHTYDAPTLRIRLFARETELGARYVAARGAYPRGRGAWTIITALASPRAAESDWQAPSLLPMPAGAKLLCVRESAAGAVQCEAVSVESPPNELVALWRRRGWRVESLRAEKQPPAWRCQREGETREARLVATPEGASVALLFEMQSLLRGTHEG